jgi:Protein of unknown function (DUF541)
MNRLTFAFLVAVVVMTAAAPAQTVAPTEISVSGSGSVTLPPNVANVSASVTTNAANAGEAVGQNNAIYDRIVAALAKLGIARADVTLAAYNVNYNPRPQGSPQPGETYGYTVARDFSVKVRDIAKAGSVVDACTGAGATSIGGVAFGAGRRQRRPRSSYGQSRRQCACGGRGAGRRGPSPHYRRQEHRHGWRRRDRTDGKDGPYERRTRRNAPDAVRQLERQRHRDRRSGLPCLALIVG